MIKLIAIDLDDTLLNTAKEISLENQLALKQARDQGVYVVLCTGRPKASILPYMKTLGLDTSTNYSITFNGGLVENNATDEILAKYTIGLEDIFDTYELITNQLQLPLDVMQGEYVLHILPTPGKRQSIYGQLNPLMATQNRQLTNLTKDETYNKMVVAYPAEVLDPLIARIPNAYRQRFNIVKSRASLLEILNKNVSKANGIKTLIDHLGIKQSEVMAIGDAENDLSMVEYAGVGVAMANAVEVVKEKAQFITTDCNHHGVKVAVDKYVLNKGE